MVSLSETPWEKSKFASSVISTNLESCGNRAQGGEGTPTAHQRQAAAWAQTMAVVPEEVIRA